MPYVLNSPPVAMPLPGLAVDYWAKPTAVPVGISRDRTRIYGSANGDNASTILYESVNDGTTWTSVRTFTEGVIALLELDDGEALVYTSRGDNAEGYIYRSAGWAASHTTATWTKVLTSPGGTVGGSWSSHFSSFGDDTIRANTSRIGVVTEYGGQSTGSGDQTLKGRRLWITQDYGATWTLGLDLLARYPGAVNMHMHASAYDPWSDRIWATYGDATQDANATQALLYSDDRGATWSNFPLPAEWAGLNFIQCTTVVALPDAILLNSDSPTGLQLWRIPRKGYRKFGGAQGVITGDGQLGQGIHRNRGQAGAPVLASYTTANAKPSGIVASPDGLTFIEVWRDPSATKVPGPITVYGPTVTGKFVALMATATSARNMLRGELVYPDGGQYDGASVFAGNGSTTVFNVAHGLGAIPSRFQGWSTNAIGGAFTMTADATNLIFTFATAPGNGTAPAVAYRWAPGGAKPIADTTDADLYTFGA